MNRLLRRSGQVTRNGQARSSKFEVTELHVAADRAFGVLLRNQDREPHNFEVRDEASHRLFVGELFSGPDEQLLAVPGLASGW